MKLTRTFVKGPPTPDFSESFTLQMGNRLSVRLYEDSRPNYLEIASLQKGLVLIFDGEELIEEGVGFGVPVVRYADKTYFSSSAVVSVEENGNLCALEKRFALDTVSRKRFWKASYINDGFYSFFHKFFNKAYKGHKSLTPAFNRTMELRRAVKIQTEFVKVKPRGTITFKYSFQPNTIKINVDLSDLELSGCQEILLLNEQGSNFFRKYRDSDGLKLFDEKIGAWENVRAKEATLSDDKDTLEFTLENSSEAALFRGLERIKGRFSWAGLSYSLHPKRGAFDYVIKLKTQKQN
jgi:hypothetical protein